MRVEKIVAKKCIFVLLKEIESRRFQQLDFKFNHNVFCWFNLMRTIDMYLIRYEFDTFHTTKINLWIWTVDMDTVTTIRYDMILSWKCLRTPAPRNYRIKCMIQSMSVI